MGESSIEERASLSLRLSAATSDLNAFVGKLRTEVDKGVDKTTMMAAPEELSVETELTAETGESRDELRSSAIKDIAAIKASDLLDAQASTAASLLDVQADTAASLLAHQAEVLNDSVSGLRDAIVNLERRTILTEERASMSEERANLTDKIVEQQALPRVSIIAAIVVMAILGLVIYMLINSMSQLKTQQTEICALQVSLHQPARYCP